MDELSQLGAIGTLTLEGAFSLLIFVIAYKIYRARISTHSGCCGDRLIVDTENAGVSSSGILDRSTHGPNQGSNV